MIGDCIYCDDRLTSELKSVKCEHCEKGFHIVCESDGSGRYMFRVEETSGLLRSTKYEIHCPECGQSWTSPIDPR